MHYARPGIVFRYELFNRLASDRVRHKNPNIYYVFVI